VAGALAPARQPNQPVLIGPVPLLYVQTISITEGYQIERIAGSRFSQALAPTTKTIAIDAMLIGPNRLRLKKELEALALVSRVLVAATAPALAVSGIPVVSGLTVSLDMQITDLRFNQSAQKRDTIDVSLTLRHVPRSSLTTVLGEVADLALAAGIPLSAAPRVPTSIPRIPRIPLPL
jgi:hypothetical protein